MTMNAISRDLYPFESHWLEIDGHRYHYVYEGKRGSEVIVLLHGNPSWSFYYRNLIRHLSSRWRVIAPDHIGMGLSDKPQVYPYTLAQHVHNLDALITYLGLSEVSFVLHDWGGLVGMGYAIQHVEQVRRFVVLNTAAFYLNKIPLSLKLAKSPVLGEMLVRGINLFARGALIWGIHHHERITAEIKAAYLAPYTSWQERVGIYRFLQDIPLEAGHQTLDLLMQIDAGLAQFSEHPALIIWGEKDPVFTVNGFLDEWTRRFPRAPVVSFTDAGHYVLEDASERILPLISAFLDNSEVQP
jgi:pimeloyl-ACP methyl ester carboxylesterase